MGTFSTSVAKYVSENIPEKHSMENIPGKVFLETFNGNELGKYSWDVFCYGKPTFSMATGCKRGKPWMFINIFQGLFLRGGPHYLCGKREESAIASHGHGKGGGHEVKTILMKIVKVVV